MTHLAVFAAAMGIVGIAVGAPFTDPTRPPAASEAAGFPAGSPAGPRLESILIAPDRRIAVINGETVVLGGQTGAGEVTRITETEVVIRGPEGEQTLRLFPQVADRASQPERGTQK